MILLITRNIMLKSAAIWTCLNRYALTLDDYYNAANNYRFIQVWLIII